MIVAMHDVYIILPVVV